MQFNVLVFLQVVDAGVVLVQLGNVFADLGHVLDPEVVHVNVDVEEDHFQPSFERVFPEQVQLAVAVRDDLVNVVVHLCILRVVDDFLHDVRVVRVVFLAFVFLHTQVVVELRSVAQRAHLGDALVRLVQDVRDELFELLAVGLEHDRAFLAVEHGLDLEDGLLDLFAAHALLLVVLQFELLGREPQVFPDFVHDVERELQVTPGEHDVLEFDEPDQFFEVCRLGRQLSELHLAVGPVADERPAVVVAALVHLAVFDPNPVGTALVGVTVVACLLAELLHCLVAFLQPGFALVDLQVVVFSELLNGLVHFKE